MMCQVKLEKKELKHLANRFEMSNALTDQIQSYSHGMRQK